MVARSRGPGIAVIGCGLVGCRRARSVAAAGRGRPVLVVDGEADRAERLAAELGADAAADWRAALDRRDVDAVVVCTPNAHLAPIGVAALESGRAVLLEKPMGRGLDEARRLAAAAERSGRVLKIGFNHRYHPALAGALELVRAGAIGRVVTIRARYGHGGRPGYEREWRADPELAGGGHLTDQGVHLLDLIHGFAGLPARAFAFLETAVWPLAPLEDNAYALFRFETGAVAMLHTGMTQWRNLFSFEVHGEDGAVCVEGLGGSYDVERLIRVRRNFGGGAPEVTEEAFPGEDRSWDLEWDDFLNALESGRPAHGTVEDGLAAMSMLDALYRSAVEGRVVDVPGA